jgi:hypothetical protein
MIKKFLLLTVMALGLASCSKGEDTPTSKENDDKLLGTWVGTVDVIAEKPEFQAKVTKLFRETYSSLLGNPYTIKVTFSNVNNQKKLKITDKNETYLLQDIITYAIKGNKITDEDTKQDLATYSFENNNKLLAENTDFFFLLVDNTVKNNEYKKQFEELNKEYPNLSSLTLEKQVEYANKVTTLQLKYNVTLRYKYKYNLIRQ